MDGARAGNSGKTVERDPLECNPVECVPLKRTLLKHALAKRNPPALVPVPYALGTNPHPAEESRGLLILTKLPRQVPGKESPRCNAFQSEKEGLSYDGNDFETKLPQVCDGFGSCARELRLGGGPRRDRRHEVGQDDRRARPRLRRRRCGGRDRGEEEGGRRPDS